MWKSKGGNPKGLGGVPPLSIPFGDVLIGLRFRLYGRGCPADTSAKQKRRPSRQARLGAPGRAPQSAKSLCFKRRRGFRDPRRGSLPHLLLRLLRQQKPTIFFIVPFGDVSIGLRLRLYGRGCPADTSAKQKRRPSRQARNRARNGISIHSRQMRLNFFIRFLDVFP